MSETLRKDVCPLVPEQLRVILAGLHLIAAQVGELQQQAVDRSLAQRLRAVVRDLEWQGITPSQDEAIEHCCLFCHAPVIDRPATRLYPFELGKLHGRDCQWVQLMRDTQALA